MIYLHTYKTYEKTLHNFYNVIDGHYYCLVTLNDITYSYYKGLLDNTTISGIFFVTCDKFRYKLPLTLTYIFITDYYRKRLEILENHKLEIILNKI